MVNTENMAAWVEALESGKYEQCRGSLRHCPPDSQPSYCCLGVASDLYEKATGSRLTSDEWFFGGLAGGVVEWLGVESNNPRVSEDKHAIGANDHDDWTFPMIAEGLRKTYLNN